MFLLVKIFLIKKTDPTCLSQQFCLIAQFFHGCSTAACLISQLFFSWLLPKHLAAARFPIFSSYSQMIAASPSDTHTHTLLHFPLRGRGGCLQDFQFCSPPLRFCPGAPQGVLFSVQQFHLRCAGEGRLFPKHISFASDLFSPCPSSPIQGGLPNAAVLLQQHCWVSVPRETVAEFHPIVTTPVAAGVSPLLSCTLRV